MECAIRPAREDDASDISAVILRALCETNAKDYTAEIIERIGRRFSPAAVLQLLGTRIVFVATAGGRVVGTASLDGSVVRTVFVAPDAQFTPKFVETASERENLSYRVKLQIAPDLARRLDGRLKAGMTADGFVRTDTRQPWPDLTKIDK